MITADYKTKRHTDETVQSIENLSREMMKLASVLVVVIAAVSVTSGEEQYTSRWDNLDVEPILRNERLIKMYFRCLMDQGKCSPEGVELKKHIPDALETGCAKCTEKQRAAIEKVMDRMFNKSQDMFKQLEAKYDPKGNYRARYTKDASKFGYELTEDGIRKLPKSEEPEKTMM